MKKILSLALALVLCLSLCACKSEAAQTVDDLILAIGTVTLDSEDAIKKAELAYELLSVKDSSKVENLSTLLDARLTYDALVEEAIRKQEELVKAVDAQIADAWDLLELLDVSATLELLDTIDPMNEDQQSQIEDIHARIEEICFPGTHFVMPDVVLDLNSDGEYTGAGYTATVTHDATDLTNAFSFHLYGLFGKHGFDIGNVYWDYLNANYDRVDDIENSEYWGKWAIEDGELRYPHATQVRVDDMGNLLTWFLHGNSTVVKLEITVWNTNHD